MVMNPVFVVLIVILAVFLIFAAPVWLLMRMIALKGEIAVLQQKIARTAVDTTEFNVQIIQLTNKVADAVAKTEAAQTRDLSTQETLRNIINKMNSRERWEKKREKEEEANREEEIEADSLLQQHGLPLFDQQPIAEPPSQKRRFGAVK